MSWSNWSKYNPSAPAPTIPGDRIWSSVDPDLQVCVEVRNAPDTCAPSVLKNMYKRLTPGLVPDIQPRSCIERGYKRALYDPEVLQSTYAWQTMDVRNPCNVNNFVYIYKFLP